MDETLLLLFTFMQGIYLKQTIFLVYVRSLLHSSLTGSQKSASPTDQAIFLFTVMGKLFNCTAHIKY